MIITINISNEFRQVFPVICGALISVSFGMMLGWPSLAYPYLLNEDVSPIIISLDETALIAGFLLEGNTIGCLFSTSKLIRNSKLAVMLCCCLQIMGWVLMFFSRDIFWFLASRSSIGFANGYGLGQLKRYIKETCEPELAKTINTYLPLAMNFGVLFMFILGGCVDFRSMAIYSAIVPILALISFGLIPKNAKPEPSNRLNAVMSMQDKNDFGSKMTTIECTEKVKPFTAIECLKDKASRDTLFLMGLVVFVQQYCGGPAHIVYSQILFISAKNPYPKVCSVIYAFCFLINMFLALKYAKGIARKTNLLVSTAVCILSLSLVSLYFWLRHELLELHELFVWAPLFLFILYNFFHSFSYGALPLMMMNERLPKRALNVASKFWTINFSMSAVISTKIFQVLYGLFGMSIGYLFFVGILLGGLFCYFFIDDYTPKDEMEKSASKVENIENGQTNNAFEGSIEHVANNKF